MKKKLIFIISLLFIIAITLFVKEIFNSKKYVNNDLSIKKETKLLTMNLEQTAGAGDYKTVTQSSWPTEGYKFNAELSRCENGSELSWDDTKKAVIVSGNLSDKCYVYFDIYQPTLAEYVLSQYTGTQGDNGIYYHDSTLANGVGDNSYRYAGANPNNYVCFGSDATTCPDDNLYRIIGVINDKIKLIKATFATKEELGTSGAYVNTSGNLDFYSFYDLSEDNKIKAKLIDINLNTNFKNFVESINEKWINFVEAENFEYLYETTEFWSGYQKNNMIEIERTETTKSLFSIMQASDYVFSSSAPYWNENILSDNSDSWLFESSSNEYINGIVTDGLSAFTPVIRQNKAIYFSETEDPLPTRPTFYLKSNVTYKSGTGTSSDPIILGD